VGLLGRQAGFLALALGLAAHPVAALMVFIAAIYASSVPALRLPPAPSVVIIVYTWQPPPPPPAEEQFRIVERPEFVIPPDEAPVHTTGRVKVRFEKDAGEHAPDLLKARRGYLGFGSDGLLARRFRPEWVDDPIPAGERLLRSYYYLTLDERGGRYRVVNQIRSRYQELSDLNAYALFDFSFQQDLETAVRREARGCHTGDDVEAVVRLDRSRMFIVEQSTCVREEAASGAQQERIQ
jgi:hypothetical protein